MPNRLLPLLACLCLASCASIKGNAGPPQVPLCPAPVQLPARALTDQEIEILWGRDRSALRDCAQRLATVTGQPTPTKP